MKIKALEKQITALPAFNLNDLRKLDSNFHRQQLRYWTENGAITTLAGGYYIFAEQEITALDLFALANKIYAPSYISLESALAYYHIIPETVLGVTSISTRKTVTYQSQWGQFSYRSIKADYMFGYTIVNHAKKNMFKLARLEKAILDYLYLNSHLNTDAAIEALRWNKEELQKLRDNEVFQTYLHIFQNKRLNKRVALLQEYIHA